MARNFGTQTSIAESVRTYSNVETDTSRVYLSSSRGRSDLIRHSKLAGFRQSTPYHAHYGRVTPSSYSCFKTAWIGFSGTSSPPSNEDGVWAGTTGVWPEKRPQFDQNQINRVVSECTAKAERFDINLGTTLGELPETMGFVAKSSITVLTAYRLARKGRFREAAKRLGLDYDTALSGKSLAEAWLAWKLGWQPLLQDVHDAIKLTQDQWHRTRPVASSVRNLSFDNQWLLPSGGPYSISSEGQARTDIQCKLYYAIPDDTFSRVTALGLTNPAAIAWELVPLSFVLDWFIPVGDFLSSFTRWQGLDYIGGYYTFANAIDCTCTYHPDYPCWGDLPSYTLNNFSFQRVPLPTPPIARIHFKIPRLSWQRSATALSLIRVFSAR